MSSPSFLFGDIRVKSSFYVVKCGALGYYLKGSNEVGEIILTKSFDDALRFKDLIDADNASLMCGGDSVQMFIIEDNTGKDHVTP